MYVHIHPRIHTISYINTYVSVHRYIRTYAHAYTP
jgi:hypothetical protein